MKKQAKKTLRWKDVGFNKVMNGKDFFISYNPNPRDNPLGKVLTDIGVALFGYKERAGKETALCKNTKGKNTPQGRTVEIIKQTVTK